MRMTRWVQVVSLVIAAMLLLVGCRKATGGGWLPSATGAGKATIAFTANCKQRGSDAMLTGQLQYHDRPAGVRLHGMVNFTAAASTCAEMASLSDPNESRLSGPYRPQPGGKGGTFNVQVRDNGEPGGGNDVFCIDLFDGIHTGYSNCQPLAKGNIQVHRTP
jgi:hypothetical protein